MKISDGEKLILLMLSELYDSLNVTGEVEPDFIRSAIISDKLWSIPWKYPGIPFENTETPQIVSDVLDILDMWSCIEYSYDQLSAEDKHKLEVEASPFGFNPKFLGFDGNSETEYLGTASFIVNRLDRFEEFKGRNFNSHCPLLETYNRMLSLYATIQSNLFMGSVLSVSQLIGLLKEQVHPSKR